MWAWCGRWGGGGRERGRRQPGAGGSPGRVGGGVGRVGGGVARVGADVARQRGARGRGGRGAAGGGGGRAREHTYGDLAFSRLLRCRRAKAWGGVTRRQACRRPTCAPSPPVSMGWLDGAREILQGSAGDGEVQPPAKHVDIALGEDLGGEISTWGTAAAASYAEDGLRLALCPALCPAFGLPLGTEVREQIVERGRRARHLDQPPHHLRH